MNDLTLMNWLALAFVFACVMAAFWLGQRVQDSMDPDKKKQSPPAE